MNQSKANGQQNIQQYWSDESYIETIETNAEKIFYYSGDHSAIIAPSSYPGKYESKWGSAPLMRHNPTDVPSIYNANYRKYYASSISQVNISGPNLICTSNSTFSLNDLPSNTTVSWSSSSNITFPSGNTGSSVSAQASSSTASGSGWIEATLTTSNRSFTLPRKDVWVGKPATPLITGPSEIGCYKLGKYISNSRFPGVWFFDKIFDWSYASIQERYDYSCEIESKDESGEIYLYIEVENRCGTKRGGKSISIIKNSGGGGLPRSVNTDLLDDVELNLSIDTSSNESDKIVSTLTDDQLDSEKYKEEYFIYMNILPNPDNQYTELNFYKDNEISEYQKSSPTMVNINLGDQDQKLGEYEIQIWHERKGLVKKIKSKDKKLQIPTNNLDEGLYFLHVIINGQVYKQKLKIKR